MMKSEAESLKEFMNKVVILDTSTSYFYVGSLAGVDDWYYILTDADVHDHSESISSKELYIMESKQFGVRKNRSKVLVKKSEIISISLLSDVIDY